jgi:hypothetical protein
VEETVTDRVRLLLEDGTVLAEGVHPVTEYEAISNETFESISDAYEFEFRALSDLDKAWLDYLHELARQYWPGGSFYSGYNAVVKL